MRAATYLFISSLFILFSACKNDKNTSEEKSVNYTEIGLNMAFTTKAELGKYLMKTIKESGASEALQFCNLKAYPITDSMATVHQATIKRVSDKTRNPDNKASKVELENIEYFKALLANEEKIEPIVEVRKNNVSFYYPIITNKMCLQCHGIPETEIKKTTMTTILALYPLDTAIGYSENQVRGIWSIQFKKQ